jgi:DNA-binding response OmpR family regulator
MRMSVGKSPCLLIVEDELPLAEAIKTKLGQNGFEVASARTLEQARNYLNELDHIDAIWLDHYLLGKGDGLDLVNIVKASDKPYANAPIFVVSNTASSDKIESYAAHGVTKYYVKAEHRLEEIIGDIKETLGVE